MTINLVAASAVTIVLGTIAANVAAAETVIKAQSAMSANLLYTQGFMSLYLERVNKLGKGSVRIDYVGGPEVTPARKAAGALRRGVFDLLYSPAGYYAGTVPESFAIHAATKSPAEIRKNGGLDLLNEVWGRKLNARILSWAISETKFNLYLTKKPTFDKNGMIDLAGMKVRTSPTYGPLLLGLGASPVSMKASELFTALQRGVVEGTGWPSVGLSKLGVGKLMKYRIDPPFYRANHLVTINRDKWASLSAEAKSVLTQVGEEFEETSVAFMTKEATADAAALEKQGLQVIRLKERAARKYLAIANDGLWRRLADRKIDVSKLKEKLD